jgi:hypothetical protein
MSAVSATNVLRSCLLAAALVLSASCTPSYTEKTGVELAGRAGLLDAVSIERGNQRLLSRQGQVCLISDTANTEAGLSLLRTMQTAFNGHFVAVNVESGAVDYLQAPGAYCPGAAYLFYVQANGRTCFDSPDQCGKYARSEFLITIVNRGDQSLLDRVRFSVRNSWLPLYSADSTRLKNAFEQLAIALTGGDAG